MIHLMMLATGQAYTSPARTFNEDTLRLEGLKEALAVPTVALRVKASFTTP
jgi:hypothetical protein